MAGRRLKEEKKYAKWMNSKTSDLYDKSLFWYGMDKALVSIIKTKEAWIVEGYNDTIAMQTNGFLNAVSSSGTSITEQQVKQLSKYCDKITLCLDGDGPGIKSMIIHIETFLRFGFRVFVKVIKDKLDPDEFVRSKDFNAKTFVEDFEASREDGFKFLMAERFKGKDEVEKATEAKVLLELILSLTDEGVVAIYSKWLSKESGVSLSNINKWSKDFIEAQEKNKVNELPAGNDWMYLLPKEVKQPISELKETIQKYQMFTANNKVWIMNHSAEPPYTFHAVTNFDIRVIQHMQDEKFPKKLIWMKNVHGREVIFDVLSSDINTPLTFENMVTNQGKFMWKGDRKDHQVLKFYLMENMGTGRMIEVMAWQPEGFWCWNNEITIPPNAAEKTAGKTFKIDGNGVFTHKDVSYYVPSANKIYANNLYKFEAQKKLVVKETTNTFLGYTTQMMKVHREHAMMGILFTISTMFQDVVVNELGFFPMFFLYGPASSGKDQLAECCQSFFGRPQTAINLEGGVSTIKAQVREFAQFANIMSHLSEYKPGDEKLDGVLKGLWDRRGYKRGNIDSHVGTESIPILSSVLMTGNYAPDQEALVTRLVWNMMEKTTFSDSEIKDYERLSDLTKKGVSGLSIQFINNRDKVIEEFKTKHREFKATLGSRKREANSRMITNLAVFGSIYQIFSNVVSFPFTFEEMLTHFEDTIDRQMNKLDSASLVNRFWECFLASMRIGQKNEQIRLQRDYKVVGGKLYFNFTNCFNRVQRQWYQQYKADAPGKDQMMKELKKDRCFVETVAGTRMSPGKNGKSTSAYVVKLSEIQISEELMSNMHFQSMEKSGDGADHVDELF